MDINEMTLADVDKRLAELETEVREMNEVADVEKATEEKRSLLERKAELEAIEQRTATANALQNGEVEPDKILEKREEITMEEKKIFGVDSPEYRNAFFANLVNKATPEQRAIFADNATAGDGVALPITTDVAIWDQILTAHPILADISIVKSGIVMKVTQMTPSNLSAAGKGKKDSDPTVELQFTPNEKVLAGKDYHTYVTLSYAESQMSQGAMEKFLVAEIANVLGEQLATDVFAGIKADSTATATTATASYFADIHTALGKAVQAQNAVIYAPSAKYYGILAEVDTNGQPIVREGVVLGATLKKDNAAADVTVVDPSLVICNVVADTTIKSQDDVKAGAFVIGGYMRAEACLRKTAAASVIA